MITMWEKRRLLDTVCNMLKSQLKSNMRCYDITVVNACQNSGGRVLADTHA